MATLNPTRVFRKYETEIDDPDNGAYLDEILRCAKVVGELLDAIDKYLRALSDYPEYIDYVLDFPGSRGAVLSLSDYYRAMREYQIVVKRLINKDFSTAEEEEVLRNRAEQLDYIFGA